MKRIKHFLLPVVLSACLLLGGCEQLQAGQLQDGLDRLHTLYQQLQVGYTRLTEVWNDFLYRLQAEFAPEQEPVSLEDVPSYSGIPYVQLEGNVPNFAQEEGTAAGTEIYAPLDFLGRCGVTFANVGPETMPTEERGAIGQVKPTGWHLKKYDCVDGKYLYNRCHLIGYQLSGENANRQNLITGTRYLNVEGMLPFENEVADYVTETGNHVFYRVTPIFRGLELVARGVQMEAWSVEDQGRGVCFNVYVYNVQPGVEIDYATGESWLAGEETPPEAEQPAVPEVTPQPEQPIQPEQSSGGAEIQGTYVLNIRSKRVHRPECSGAVSISPANRQVTDQTLEELLTQGFVPCGECKP